RNSRISGGAQGAAQRRERRPPRLDAVVEQGSRLRRPAALRRAGRGPGTAVSVARLTQSVSRRRQMARTLGLRRVAITLCHRPVGLVRQSIAEGGPWQQRKTELGRRCMIDAARGLAPLAAPPVDHGARVAFLSGDAYWYQTLFCFASLQARVSERVTPTIFE